MKNHLLAILLALSTIHNAFAEEPTTMEFINAVPFISIEEHIKVTKKTVAAIQFTDSDKWMMTGTGFLVQGKRNTILVITCLHVIAGALNQKKTLHVGLDTKNGYKRFPVLLAYADPVNDIAILSISSDKSKKSDMPDNSYFGSEAFDVNNEYIVEGRGVLIPGYPLALGMEEGQNHPVVRHAMVAQYTGKDYFLLDGLVSRGNSGSPVIALKGMTGRLIGMVNGFENENINLYDESGQLISMLPYNSGLTRCVTMKEIQKAIDKAKY